MKRSLLLCAALLTYPAIAHADNLAVVGRAFLLFVCALALLSLLAASIIIFIVNRSFKSAEKARSAEPGKDIRQEIPMDGSSAFPLVAALAGSLWGIFAGYSLHLVSGEAGGYVFAALFSGAAAAAGYLLGHISVRHFGTSHSYVSLIHGLTVAVSGGIIAESVGIISVTVTLAFVAGTAAGHFLTLKMGSGRCFTSLVMAVVLSLVFFIGMYNFPVRVDHILIAVPLFFITSYGITGLLLGKVPWRGFFVASLVSPLAGVIGLIIAVTSGSDELTGFFLYAVSGFAASIMTLFLTHGRKLNGLNYVLLAAAFAAGAVGGGISGELVGLTEAVAAAIGGFTLYGAVLVALGKYMEKKKP